MGEVIIKRLVADSFFGDAIVERVGSGNSGRFNVSRFNFKSSMDDGYHWRIGSCRVMLLTTKG